MPQRCSCAAGGTQTDAAFLHWLYRLPPVAGQTLTRLRALFNFYRHGTTGCFLSPITVLDTCSPQDALTTPHVGLRTTTWLCRAASHRYGFAANMRGAKTHAAFFFPVTRRTTRTDLRTTRRGVTSRARRNRRQRDSILGWATAPGRCGWRALFFLCGHCYSSSWANHRERSTAGRTRRRSGELFARLFTLGMCAYCVSQIQERITFLCRASDRADYQNAVAAMNTVVTADLTGRMRAPE